MKGEIIALTTNIFILLLSVTHISSCENDYICFSSDGDFSRRGVYLTTKDRKDVKKRILFSQKLPLTWFTAHFCIIYFHTQVCTSYFGLGFENNC